MAAQNSIQGNKTLKKKGTYELRNQESPRNKNGNQEHGETHSSVGQHKNRQGETGLKYTREVEPYGEYSWEGSNI